MYEYLFLVALVLALAGSSWWAYKDSPADIKDKARKTEEKERAKNGKV